MVENGVFNFSFKIRFCKVYSGVWEFILGGYKGINSCIVSFFFNVGIYILISILGVVEVGVMLNVLRSIV